MTTTPIGSASILGGGITISPGSASNVTTDIKNNNIQGSKGTAIHVDTPSGTPALPVTANADVTVNNNAIGTLGSSRSGAYNADGIGFDVNGHSRVDALITSNNVRRWTNKFGIALFQGDGQNATLNATLRGNTLSEPDNALNNGPGGIHVRAGLTSTPNMGGGPDAGIMCLDAGGAGAFQNNIATAGLDLSPTSESVDMYVWQRFNARIQMPGFPGGTDDSAETYLQARNSGNGAPTVYAESTPTGGFQSHTGGCPTP
jgi:hypothetical protein